MRLWGVLGLLIALGEIAPARGDEPDILIRVGTSGTIRATRVWEQADQLCYESRGFQHCVPKAQARIESGRIALSASLSPPGASPYTSEKPQAVYSPRKPAAPPETVAALLATKPRFNLKTCEEAAQRRAAGSEISLSAIRHRCSTAYSQALTKYGSWTHERSLVLDKYSVDDATLRKLNRNEVTLD